MATTKSRLLALEAERKNRPIIATPEFLADMQMVEKYFELNGRNLDTKPPADFTKIQCEILAAWIKVERYCSG